MNVRISKILKKKALVFLATPLVALGIVGGALALSQQPDQRKDDSATLTTTSNSTPHSAPSPEANEQPQATEDAQTTTAVAPDLKPQEETTNPTAPPPVTVASFQEIAVGDEGDVDCKLTYSDGTTYQWHWTDVNPQGTWLTDSSGNNGYWLPSSQVTGSCDTSVVGRAKL